MVFKQQKGTQSRFIRPCAPVELPERFPPRREVAPSVVGRFRPAFSEYRPKSVLLPESFCVPLRRRLGGLSRFHRPIYMKLYLRAYRPAILILSSEKRICQGPISAVLFRFFSFTGNLSGGVSPGRAPIELSDFQIPRSCFFLAANSSSVRTPASKSSLYF